MPLSKEELKASEDIIKELDNILENGPWDDSLFFKGIGKKLRDARDRFVKDLQLDVSTEKKTESDQGKEGFMEVYIALYQAEGNNLLKWQTAIANLSSYNVTRPVYRNEADVKDAIRQKEFRQNDAYVVTLVNKDHILQPYGDKPPLDRSGHELLVLKEGAIRLENISRFTHESGEYDYRGGMLYKKI